MSNANRDEPFEPGGPSGRWSARVMIAQTDEGLPYAYRPQEVITTRGEEALEVAQSLHPGARRHPDTMGSFSRLTSVADPLHVVHELGLNGIAAHPNHVFFAHGAGVPNAFHASPLYGSPLYGSPLYGSPLYGSPLYGSPLYGSPLYGSPLYGSPLYGSPLYGSPLKGSRVAGSRHVEPTRSSALPPPANIPTDPIAARIGTDAVADAPTVIVFDTGLADGAYRPTLGSGIKAASKADVDRPDEDGDGYLDPAAGHGTFIAGVIAQIAPGCNITVHRVLSTFGDGDEWTVSQLITGLKPLEPERTILSLSFGGYVLERPHLLARAIRQAQARGIQVVASAGNDATSRPCYPAALPGVIAVGALGPSGPAPFTNYGDWVNACAPGTDVLSAFFNFEGKPAPGPYGDANKFEGWAMWSGTSFSAPVVVGNAARMMMTGGGGAKDAFERLIDGASLTTVPYLGTIVDAL